MFVCQGALFRRLDGEQALLPHQTSTRSGRIPPGPLDGHTNTVGWDADKRMGVGIWFLGLMGICELIVGCSWPQAATATPSLCAALRHLGRWLGTASTTPKRNSVVCLRPNPNPDPQSA